MATGRAIPPLLLFLTFLWSLGLSSSSSSGVQLQVYDEYVVVENEIVQLNLSNPGGWVIGVKYNGIDNLLEVANNETDRGYWDLVWSKPNVTAPPRTTGRHPIGKKKKYKGTLDRMEATKLKVIVQNGDQVELSFTREWNSSLEDNQVPLNIDKRFVMLGNSSGFYTYGIYNRLKGWPAFELDNTRIAFKLRKDLFHYMAISGNRQRYMPLPDDRSPERGQALAYPEAVLLVNPLEPEFKGEVDDKYQYSCESKDLGIHGWISNDTGIGFWQISPSYEFRSGGPFKQFLNSHVGPTNLGIFHSTHYSGADMIIKFKDGEQWKKVYGPIFIYVNSLSEGNGNATSKLWEDAKDQLKREGQSWPYSFPASEDFPKSNQRGNVKGRLLVHDRYVSKRNISAKGAYVGLALPGDVGFWQVESKGYQFWSKADEDGCFSIANIRTGKYNLYATVPGFIGDYQYNGLINIAAGCSLELGDLVYVPPRNGSTLWEIGNPDRSAAEFYVPDPNPKLINKLYVHTDRFRQYGLWERYAELYPHQDLVYKIGDNYRKDWFFVQVTRSVDNSTYEGTTWQIQFKLNKAYDKGTYTLRLALATAHASELQVVMDNGILHVKLSKPAGFVTEIGYNGIKNLLEVRNEESNRGYWDLVWSEEGATGTTGTSYRIGGKNFKIIVENEEQVEISFTSRWDRSLEGKIVPLNIDKRFIMLRNSSGFYSYAIYEHLQDWPAFNLPQTRIVFKLTKDKFHYMAIADNRQRWMPLPDDRLPGRGKELATPEAVLLVKPVEPEFKGEVDDKYLYSCENRNLKVHGWICFDPPVGFWQITPSNEFRSGGPIKQNLTSHVGPTTLAMFLSAHYVGEDMVLKFKEGEPWKKVFGPVFFYLNSLFDDESPLSLWEDAKQQMWNEEQTWPYNFPQSDDFPQSDQRGNVSGRLHIRDRFVSDDHISAEGAYVGLAPPGDVGSWQLESKGYQFWTKADIEGYFCINDIRAGDYNLYAWMSGFIGDYRYDAVITITAGSNIDLGDLTYEPPRHGPTLWEIGIPDRTAAEFYIPDPNPMYINKLYVNHPDRYRQYGLWERYTDLYPDKDLVYIVGVSDYTKDWFFAHVPRKINENSYQATTWQIKFKIDDVDQTRKYTLQLALGTANSAELQIRVNDPEPSPPLFSTGQIGHDNTIARHGIHGIYRLYSVEIPGGNLVQGDNTIYLTQANAGSPFQGVMYDYIRLEGPPSEINVPGKITVI